MTQEQEKLYEFLVQLKNWHEQLQIDANESKKHAETLKKKDRKFTHRYVAELESQAYVISQVYAEFEAKFDLGFKEVESFKEESKTLPGVFYDVIKLERLNGETKFQLKLNGEYCCHPNKAFFESMKNDPPKIVSVDIVKDAMQAVGFDGDTEKPFRSCGIDKDVKDISIEAGEITSFRPIQ